MRNFILGNHFYCFFFRMSVFPELIPIGKTAKFPLVGKSARETPIVPLVLPTEKLNFSETNKTPKVQASVHQVHRRCAPTPKWLDRVAATIRNLNIGVQTTNCSCSKRRKMLIRLDQNRPSQTIGSVFGSVFLGGGDRFQNRPKEIEEKKRRNILFSLFQLFGSVPKSVAPS